MKNNSNDIRKTYAVTYERTDKNTSVIRVKAESKKEAIEAAKARYKKPGKLVIKVTEPASEHSWYVCCERTTKRIAKMKVKANGKKEAAAIARNRVKLADKVVVKSVEEI